MAVLSAGVAQLTGERKKINRLAVVQIVTGILEAVISFLVVIWGYPTRFDAPIPEGSEIGRMIFFNPGPKQMRVELVTAMTSVLGLAVFGVGIAQYIKSRHEGRA